MDSESWIVFSGIVPHPPIMVPEVGRASIQAVRDSINAMQEFTERLIESGAETIILMTPHAPLEAEAFVAYEGPVLRADFVGFGAPETAFELSVDERLLNQIAKSAADNNYKLKRLEKHVLDHGSSVPLYFMIENGWRGQVVILGYCFLPTGDHLKFGACIRRAVEQHRKPVAFVASGDLSHRLKPGAPAGYNAGAHSFDEEVVAALEANDLQRIVDIDPTLRKLAGECGYRSMLTVIGATQLLPASCEVLSYEGPFGVGYLVAQLTAAPTDRIDESSNEQSELAREITSIARNSVESFVSTGHYPEKTRVSEWLEEPAPCFVSIKTISGELRGCIGTVEPTRNSLSEEITVNAVSAATNDPRFPPIEVSELDGLRYSVDVLMPAEKTTLEELDPAVYGVIVEDPEGSRRGLLLPDIPGVNNSEQQVEIAASKAGIARGSQLKIYRFKVQRFREKKLRIKEAAPGRHI